MKAATRASTRRSRRAVLVALCLGAAFVSSGTALADPLREGIRQRIEAAGLPAQLVVGDELVYASQALPRFYESRGYRPAWVQDAGGMERIQSLLTSIRAASEHGLRPRHYHLRRIEQLVTEVQSAPAEQRTGMRSDLDLLCTDAFLVYGAHLVSGQVDPESIEPDWSATRREVDLVGVLEEALAKNRVQAALMDLLPDHSEYAALCDALARYRKAAARDTWSSIVPGPKLERGTQGERVVQLRQRLRHALTLQKVDVDSGAADVFDDGLEEAVRDFQRLHGLDPDGVVGPATLAALNVPLEERIKQIKLNLERWRWLPQDLGERFILVNIPAFEATVVDQTDTVMVLPAIVGKSLRRTPVFSGRMTYLVLSPYWEVPHRLAVQDKLPAIQKDNEYFDKEKMRVFLGWGADAAEIDPTSIDWSRVTSRSFPYRLRQDPGPRNALGQVKFMFPNKHNVYLHDTSARQLFSKSDRTLSSGCIRIDRPLDLAEYLLQPEWSRERLDATIAEGVPRTVSLPAPIPVHLLYWTAWVADDGRVAFRRDLYGRDARLEAALGEDPPEAPESHASGSGSPSAGGAARE